ncbi:DUF1501 domain-containing protein [Comamonas composti]|uniref:DUF1501 domain-containing protein n=1 Tax=Comamonas composti TaxID=408558 RepID=UPI00041B9AC0|nr:DUF1501 domain-containing protein [Comamonas composti]
MQRRHLLHWASALPLTGYMDRLQAALPGAGTPRLLVVFLRGAYDCCSLLVPTHSDYYWAARPTIAIARPGQACGALALDGQWGLHPVLEDCIYPLFQNGQACFIPFAGIDDLSRSHFETQDAIELGQPPGGHRNYPSGFLNRLAQVLARGRPSTPVMPMAFTSQLPLVLRGRQQVANMELRSVTKPGIDEARSRLIASMYQGTPLEAAVHEGFAVSHAVQNSVQQEMEQAGRNAISPRGFALVARRMAALMRERFDLGFVDVGGWDTHINQGGSRGPLANRLRELGQGLSSFAQEIGPEPWRHTVVVVLSEFGRTFRENGSQGTDHGHGTVYWLLGGGLSSSAGGRIVGEQIELGEKSLFQNRDHPVLNEYRAVLGGLFARMYGLNAQHMQQVFSGVSPRDLQLV